MLLKVEWKRKQVLMEQQLEGKTVTTSSLPQSNKDLWEMFFFFSHISHDLHGTQRMNPFFMSLKSS